MKRIRLILAGERFEATLLEQEAARTCAAVWQRLPLSGELWHSHFIGPALTTPVEIDRKSVV